MNAWNNFREWVMDIQKLGNYKETIADLQNEKKELKKLVNYYKSEKKHWKDSTAICHEALHETNKSLVTMVRRNSELKELVSDQIVKTLDKKYKRVKLIYTKRNAIGSSKGLPLAVQDYCRPSITLVNNLSIAQVFRSSLTYIKDNYLNNGISDVWQLPEETHVFKAGDCEDMACYRLALIKSSFNIKPNIKKKFFVSLGYYGKTGHAFIVEVNDNSDFIVHEPTKNSYKPIQYLNQTKYKIYYLFNEYATFEVTSGAKFGSIKKEFGLVQRKK